MEYISDSDLDYVLNKYHDTKKPFNPFSRFVRNDKIFPTDSGLSPEEIRNGILLLDEKNRELPHPVRKALAFEFVLDNTRISTDTRDIFPAINMIDRPLSDTIVSKWKREVFTEIIPDVEARRARLEQSGCATVWPDFDHSVPVWDRVFSLGFAGLLAESEAARVNYAKDRATEAFFDGIAITYRAILRLINRLAELSKKTGAKRMTWALRKIAVSAPDIFYEALLVDYLYFILCEHIEGLQVRSLCNFDRLLYPFYKSDLERGITEEELRRDLAYFLLQFPAIGNYWNQPVYLGGCNVDESSVINELSYVFLDVYDKMGIYNPKIQIKVAKSTPKDYLLKALDMIRRGRNSIVFVNDATVRGALVRAGATPDEARLADIKGCYEYAVQGAYGSASMTYINLLKPLEYALHSGCDGVSGALSGLECPSVGEYKSFDVLYAEYKRQLAHVIDEVIEVVGGFEGYLHYVNPQSMLSATVPECLLRGRDVLLDGATRRGNGAMFGFLADISDSLTNIKKYVFDKKELTLTELRDALDANFEGYESLRLRLRADRDKYGNNKDLPDGFACDIAAFVSSLTVGRPTAKERDGKWTCGFHVARQSYTQAPKTAASANGRRLGEELSKNVSASMGMNREGATAAILSATKIDATAFASDAALDLGLLPSAVKGEDGLLAMYGLLQTFCGLGGHAMHINVFDADTLRAAQREPEKYKDLQIRVCGWNVLWSNINKEEQDGFIRQAEALV